MGRFLPGQSGNPGGRSKGAAAVARLIRKSTRDGAELVEFALKILRDPEAKMADRQWATEFLADRGLGKALQTVEVGEIDATDGQVDLSQCTDEQLEALASLPIADGDDAKEPELELDASALPIAAAREE